MIGEPDRANEADAPGDATPNPYSGVCGKLKPFKRLDVVAHHTLAKGIANANVVHGLAISDGRTAKEPAHCNGESCGTS
jgi:hypothetical protein